MLDAGVVADQVVLREVARQCAVAETVMRRSLGAIESRWEKPCRLPVLPSAIAGFAELWSQEVPEDRLERSGETVWLSCSCGAEKAPLAVAVVHMCPGDCGLWVLRTEEAVLFKRWPREQPAQVAA